MHRPSLGLSLLLLVGAACDQGGSPTKGEAAAPKTAEAKTDPGVKAAEAKTGEAADGADEPEAADGTDEPEAADGAEPEAADGAEPKAADGAEPEAADGADEPEAAPADGPRSVLILGSSMAKTAFGAMLEDTLDEHEQVECHRFAKSATGLSRPDFFDWTATATAKIEHFEPDAVLVVMGGNDGQDLRELTGKARVEWGSDGWADAYRERVDAFVTLLAGDDRQVLWLGIPRTNTTKLEAKLDIIREVHKAAVEAHPRGVYIDPTPMIEADDGSLMKQIQVKGKTQDLRGDDGVHFTMAGSRYLADAIAPTVLEAIGVAAAEAPAEADVPAEEGEAAPGEAAEGAAPQDATKAAGDSPSE